ncbi:MAG: hypothetical protein HXY37_01220, partial [Chloroflexi bacterium]|nr:hypothetical protein [Chloroflexota bacterium]
PPPPNANLTSLFRFGPTAGAAHFVSGDNVGPDGSLVVTADLLPSAALYRFDGNDLAIESI